VSSLEIWTKVLAPGVTVTQPFAMEFKMNTMVVEAIVFTEFDSSMPPPSEKFDVPSQCMTDKN